MSFIQLDSEKMLFVLPLLVVLYFLPSIIAVMLNRQHKGKIFVANIPAGFSWVLWFGILAWVITGKEKVKPHKS